MEDRRRVLFVCTGNACRSQMAEAILRHVGGAKFESLSAGSRPAGFIHPLAEKTLAGLRIPLGDQRSKSWDEFIDSRIDVVITLCDSAAAEACPNFPGPAIRVHWGLPDPSFQPGTEADRQQFALRVAERIRAKIDGLMQIDFEGSEDEVRKRLEFLGEI